jgi:predicted NAD/FAD-binding protein/DUF1365 family protein
MTGATTPLPRTAAVIGSGVAGLTAAHVLHSCGVRVTLFEADPRFGGHADTHQVGDLAIDTGFIVHNERTYPVLLRLFAELGVQTHESEMSLSVRCDPTGLEYAGALGARGLFPSWRNLTRPSYLRLLTEIPRFHRAARLALATGAVPGTDPSDETLGAFLDRGHFSPLFRSHFMEPLVAAVWSCDPAVAQDYPARYLFTFLAHHGMLQVFGSPTWRTVTGGSREYVARVVAQLPDVRPGTKVTSVLETTAGVEITDGNGQRETFDAVVIATHPDQALAMLAQPSPAHHEVLGAMPYSTNLAQLHTDDSILPRHSRARASWNYLRRETTSDRVTVTYDLTRLQRLPTDTAYLVTLGGTDLVDQAKVIDTMEYAHPLYTPSSVAAQARLPELNSARLAFAGAYQGWGFHEDGARSGLAAAENLGATWVSDGGHGVPRPGLFATTIRHTRRTPFRRTFTHHNHTWLVDLDRLPDHGALGRFEARDHLGDPKLSLRANVEDFLRAHQIELDGGRVLLAANARAFGYCFNPISVFWCYAATGALAAVIVEVHNTYGDRHAYLVHPDDQGRAQTPKQMYVSPFHGVDGTYDLAVPVPTDRLQIAVTLRTDDGEVFSASLSGRRTTASALQAAPAAALGSALIRAHGIWLWARRLPVRPRPSPPAQSEEA